MEKHLILSVISKDHPGIVKEIAGTVKDHGGNWLESSLNRLAGKFAGVIRISVPEQNLGELKQALSLLSKQAITVYVEELLKEEPRSNGLQACFSAIGPDRSGIVKEISLAFAQHQINLESLSTNRSSAPHTGDPIFEAEGELTIPTETQLDDLYEQLEKIADQLAIDIHLEDID